MRLHEQVKHQKEVIEGYQIGISEITRYLELDKFSKDIYVNKNDIHLRLDEIKNYILTIEGASK
tara:strand:- start:496 stop:687 length:192 start_codon:yes stop_codon:yes gene_type:complete